MGSRAGAQRGLAQRHGGPSSVSTRIKEKRGATTVRRAREPLHRALLEREGGSGFRFLARAREGGGENLTQTPRCAEVFRSTARGEREMKRVRGAALLVLVASLASFLLGGVALESSRQRRLLQQGYTYMSGEAYSGGSLLANFLYQRAEESSAAGAG